MDIDDILSPENVIASLKAASKKQALQELANHAARATGLPARDIFNILLQREQLGSTGVGHGIAIPHGKLDGVARIVGVFARLTAPIEFDALDDEPVDLLFLLIAPVSAGADHLKALSRISRQLRDPATIAKLRSSRDAAALYSILVEPTASASAA